MKILRNVSKTHFFMLKKCFTEKVSNNFEVFYSVIVKFHEEIIFFLHNLKK